MGKQVPFFVGQECCHVQVPIYEESETLGNISTLQLEAYLHEVNHQKNSLLLSGILGISKPQNLR